MKYVFNTLALLLALSAAPVLAKDYVIHVSGIV